MKKSKSGIWIVIVLVLCFAIGGYFLKDFFKGITIDTPVLEIDSSDTTLKWQWDMEVNSYKLYDNNTLLDTFTVSEDPINKYSIDFSDYLTEYKEYNFKIVAFVSEESNKSSNVVVYLHQDPNIATSTNYGVLVNNSTLAPKNLTYGANYTLSWDAVADATKYYVCAIYGNDDVYSFETNDTSANVFNYLDQEITAFRVGANYGATNTYFGDMVTVNMVNAEDIYKKVYYFNGEFNDYYITSSQELINVLYYSFTAKDTDVNVKFSPNALMEIMGKDIYISDTVLNKYIDAITETCNYSFSNKSFTKYKYKFTFNYNGVTSPSKDSTNKESEYSSFIWTDTTATGEKVYSSGFVTYTLLQSDVMLPYYQNYSFSSRSNDTTFASDNKMILVECSSSEELYWCIESGATPTFTSAECKAYEMYDMAKSVLIDVVSNSMTTYEKILSIYDYICMSSVYDYWVVEQSTRSGFISTDYKCFYLESLLSDNQTKLAVCDGYSKTFSLLCNMENIDCYRVTGIAQTSGGLGAHAWNKVKLGDKWYVVDITWTEYSLMDEAVNVSGIMYSQNKYEVLGHKYFLVNDSFVSENHFSYSNDADRTRFTNTYGLYTFNSYFPSVYMNTPNYESLDFYDYYTNTNLGDGVDRYIKNATEINEFLSYIKHSNDTNLEIVVSNNILGVIKESFLMNLASKDCGGYSIYEIGNVEYESQSKTVSGTIYIITTLD